MADDEEKNANDGSVDWINSVVRASCPNMKKEVFQKQMGKEETKEAIRIFLEGGEPSLLFNGDILTVMNEFPSKIPKNKCIYFLNTSPGDSIEPKNLQAQVCHGEMCADPLEHLEKTLRDVLAAAPEQEEPRVRRRCLQRDDHKPQQLSGERVHHSGPY